MECSIQEGEDKVHYIQIGKTVLRLDLEDLDEEYCERSKQELRELPENVEEALVALKTLLAEEENLQLPLDDKPFLMKFLRPNKFYANSTFKMMRNYYRFKDKNPKYCAELRPKPLRHVFEANVLTLLPTRTPAGERTLIAHIGKNWTPSKVSLCELFRAVIMVLEIAMLEPKTQVGGVHVILDQKGLSFNHVMQFSPSFAKIMLTFVQECAPIRLKGVHIVNQPYIFNMLYAIFKPFIGEKLKKRIHFHGTNWAGLHEKFPKDCLPECYGGDLEVPEFPGNLFADLLCLYDKEFEFCETLGYTNNGKKIDKIDSVILNALE